MSILLTPSAAKRIDYLVKKNNAIALRFSVKESGCSGYSYHLDFTDEVADEDEVFKQHGVEVVVDRDSLKILDGTQIDYVSQGLNQSFSFSNPKASDTCGCGESFSL